jgi:serine phosphatase RsbU (regulator of sigma subunit)
MAAPCQAGGDQVSDFTLRQKRERSELSVAPTGRLERLGAWLRPRLSMGPRLPARRRLALLALLGVVLTLSVASAAMVCLNQLGSINDRMAEINRAGRYHQDADMMHDALRADVVRAQQAVAGVPGVRARGVARETLEHTRQFRTDMRRLAQLDLPPNLEQAVSELRPVQATYLAGTEDLVRATLAADGQRDPARAQRAHDRVFHALTGEQAGVTDRLSAASRRAERAAVHEQAEAVRMIAGASIGAMAGWMAILLWHHRSSGRLNGALLREAVHRSAADVLQRSLLPERLPKIEGVELAGRSLPGQLGHHVGGDWYDVITLPSGELGLVVGDVVGHDLAAATAMGQLRNALRAYALDDFSPAGVLTRLNRAADLLDVVELATCIYAILDPRTLTVRWSSAGHLAPLVSDESGTAGLAAVDPGPPLGALPKPGYVDSVLQLRHGDALVLYTDGLVERRGESIDAGLDELAAIRGPHPSADAMCDLLFSTLLGDRPRADDVTLLVVQTVAEARRATA